MEAHTGSMYDHHRSMQSQLSTHSPNFPHSPGLQPPAHYPGYSTSAASMPGAVMNSSAADSQLKRDKDAIYGWVSLAECVGPIANLRFDAWHTHIHTRVVIAGSLCHYSVESHLDVTDSCTTEEPSNVSASQAVDERRHFRERTLFARDSNARFANRILIRSKPKWRLRRPACCCTGLGLDQFTKVVFCSLAGTHYSRS